MKKQEIKKTIIYQISDYIEGGLDETISWLQEIKEKHKEYSRFEISVIFNEYSEEDTLSLIGIRLETDSEFKTRCETETKERHQRIIEDSKATAKYIQTSIDNLSKLGYIISKPNEKK